MSNSLVLVSCGVWLSFTAANFAGDDVSPIVVDMHIRRIPDPAIGSGILFDGQPSLDAATDTAEGRMPSGHRVLFDRDDAGKRRITIDRNGDGELADEQPLLLDENGETVVDLVCTPAGQPIPLPFQIRWSQWERKDKRMEGCSVYPRYEAIGETTIGDTTITVGFRDLQADGDWDAADLRQGTAICIDRNGDGRFWGADEFRWGNELFEIGGKLLTAGPDSAAMDGTSITFLVSDLQIPKIGRVAPKFKLKPRKGDPVTGTSLRGQVVLLDFWASWCAPCVAKLDAMVELQKTYADDLRVYYFSTDKSSQFMDAMGIAKDKGLPEERLIVTGRGKQQPTWKIFGSMPETRMSLPTYVLLDRKGVVRFAGKGSDTNELIKAIREAIKAGK